MVRKAANTEEEHIELNPTEARQGRFGWHVLAILVASLTLALIIVGGLTLYYTAGEDTGEPPALAREGQ